MENNTPGSAPKSEQPDSEKTTIQNKVIDTSSSSKGADPAEKTQVEEARPTSGPATPPPSGQVARGPSASMGVDSAEKTRIEDVRSTSGPASPPPPGQSTNSASSTSSLPPRPESGMSKKKGVSPGVAIGAAAAAGVAGVTLGTVYSEEIQAGVDKMSESISGMVSDTEGEDAVVVDPGEIEPIPDDMSDAVNSISGHFTDADGNIYSVSLQDYDGDGAFEVQELDIQGLDGSNLHVASNGDALNPMLTSFMGMAGPEDYVEAGGYAIPASFVDQVPGIEDYLIQPGDTLSEIAQAHQTSIVNIMELNPDITDPNQIQAGAHLIIPTNDHIDDPYQGFDSSVIESNDNSGLLVDVGTDDSVDVTGLAMTEGGDLSETDYGTDLTENVSYETVEWESFDDGSDAASDNGYGEMFNQTDFDSLGGDSYDATDFL